MDLIEHIKNSLYSYIETKYLININELENLDTTLNTDSTKQDFGDITTNIAFLLSKKLKIAPNSIANEIRDNFKNDYIEKIIVAGPGFINLYLNLNSIIKIALNIFDEAENYFKNKEIKIKKYSVEFVSANPTGPLHIGHGRGGIIGDVYSNILKFLGHNVTKEFYINDAGNQIEKLGKSLKLRILELLGHNIELPEDAYHGQYLIDLAKKFLKKYKIETIKDLESIETSIFALYAKDKLLEAIKKTLSNYGINYDVWFSESLLHNDKSIENSINKLKDKNYIYEKDGALWFRSTDFFDDKDRVIKKASGEYTYVAADIAYLENKIKRGADYIVMILGQDHHSYLRRLKSIMNALGYNPDNLIIILYQLVTIKESGQILRLSKRAGRIITLQDIIDTVGSDIARFFYLNKKADAHLDFDIDLALKQTDENPVYYIQYAYVRTISILKKAQEELKIYEQDIDKTKSSFIGISEKLLIKKIASLKNLLISISKNYQVHLLSYFAIELAQTFHNYYSINKVIDKNNLETTYGRLFVILLLKRTFETCFKLLGLSAPKYM